VIDEFGRSGIRRAPRARVLRNDEIRERDDDGILAGGKELRLVGLFLSRRLTPGLLRLLRRLRGFGVVPRST
jgi:hypothetical protein